MRKLIFTLPFLHISAFYGWKVCACTQIRTTFSYVLWVQISYMGIRRLAAKEHYIHSCFSCFEALYLNKQHILKRSKNTFHEKLIGVLA